MGERIGWRLAVDVDDGPSFSTNQEVIIEAYDRIQIEVPGADPPASETATVQVQPVEDADKVELILISSNRYGPDLTVQASGTPLDGSTETTGRQVQLEAPIHLVGGAVALLGVAPETLDFENSLGEDKPATITILVGRQAT